MCLRILGCFLDACKQAVQESWLCYHAKLGCKLPFLEVHGKRGLSQVAKMPPAQACQGQAGKGEAFLLANKHKTHKHFSDGVPRTNGTKWRFYCGIQQKTADLSQGRVPFGRWDGSRFVAGTVPVCPQHRPAKMFMFIVFSCPNDGAQATAIEHGSESSKKGNKKFINVVLRTKFL